jgi:prenylcysteine oxidase / farnesylcysteine lyase
VNRICIVVASISNASTVFFLTNYTTSPALHLRFFERCSRVSGCFTTITIARDYFEAGGSMTPTTSMPNTSLTS